MLRSLKRLEHCKIDASDGEVGKVVDFFLDDERWIVRYLVVDTGGLLKHHEVLIAPGSVLDFEWSSERFHLALTKERVENSPSVDTHSPVSRREEEKLLQYYGYPRYWDVAGVWGAVNTPALIAAEAASADRSSPQEPVEADKSEDSHLRSSKEVRGYDIIASDGSIGHVEDFIAADDIWQIRYLVIDTSNWWIGKKVLVSPQWATRISWGEQSVYVDMSKEAIQGSPEWDPSVAVERDYERRLYEHYRRPPYWDQPSAGRERRRSGTG